MKNIGRRVIIWGCGALLVLGLAACRTGSGARATEKSGEPSGGTNSTGAISTNVLAAVETLRVGDLVKIDFSGTTAPIPFHEENIKQDGTISLELIGSVQAAGKTTGQLQRELNEQYKKFYNNLNVTVRAQERFYFVGGEVKKEDRQIYIGPTTLTRAIQSAGGFSDFANKRKVQITRENGKIEYVNWNKASKDAKLDLPIYPGDSIHVERTLWR